MKKKIQFLYNRVDRRELKERIANDPTPRTTISFYKYHAIPDPMQFRDELFASWAPWDVLGRVYVANEGINAQISVPTEHFETFKVQLYSIDFLNNVRLNTAVDDNGKSFFKLAIKVRKKIVADGIDDPGFDPSDCGKHVSVEEFNQLSEDPDTVIVDMRNHYESEVGHFKGAICPDVDTFREELDAVEEIMKGKEDKKLLMYCTGGIRCEKASAYFKKKGFKNVFQLEGGIIKYARDAKEKGLENRFIGKNFVFDERLGERITDDVIAHCHQCGAPCDTHTNCKNDACHLLFIQCEKCAAKYNECCSVECSDFINLPLDEQKRLRKTKVFNTPIFQKGRLRPKMENGEIKESMKLSKNIE